MKTNAEKLPSPWVSAIPLAVLTGLLYVVIRAFGGEAINGGSQIALLSATSVCVMLSIGIYRCRWAVLEEAIIDNIRASASAIVILLLIGAIAGTWMISGVVFACAAMLLAQPELVARVAGVGELDFMSGFKGVLMTCFGPTAIPTGAPQLDELVATRGMAGMLNTVWLIICAMCFGGVMTGSGMLRSLTSIFLRWVRRAFSAVASTVGAGLFFNLCTADQYISIILSGRLFRDLYADRGLEPRLLSRSVEDSATVCSVLIPWNSCGMTQATVLGVSTFVYAPYCIFNIVSPLMSLLVAAVGWNIKRKK